MNLTAIIPTKNRVELTLRAISSCMQIPVINEILVIDDGSTCDNIQLLKKNVYSKNVHVINNSLQPGALAARIFGASIATNEIIVYLDSDDTLCCDGVINNFNQINKNPDVGLIYSNVVHGTKQTDWLQISGFERDLILKNLSLCAFSGMIVRKHYLDQCNLMLSLPAWQDDEFCLQLSKYCKIQFMPGIVAYCSDDGIRISSSKKRQLEGLRLLLQKYQSEIRERYGKISIIFWNFRILSLVYLLKAEENSCNCSKYYYNFVGRAIRKSTKIYFNRIYV